MYCLYRCSSFFCLLVVRGFIQIIRRFILVGFAMIAKPFKLTLISRLF